MVVAAVGFVAVVAVGFVAVAALAAVVFAVAVTVVFAVAVTVDFAVVVWASHMAVTAAGLEADTEEASVTADTAMAASDMALDSASDWDIGEDGGIPITDITDIRITATHIPPTIIPTRIPLTIQLRQ